MEALFALIGLAILAIPGLVIYLLVRVNNLQSQINTLDDNLAELRVKHAIDKSTRSPTTEIKQTADTHTEQAKAVNETEVNPAPILSPADTDSATQTITSMQVRASQLLDKASAKANDGSRSNPNSSSSDKRAKPAPNTATSNVSASEPTIIDQALTYIQRYFTEGNIIVRVGVLVLFAGVAFLLKYASDSGMLPVELRLLAVATAGIALLLNGWRLRDKRFDYAVVMQGAGIGILYLTAFATLKLFPLLPSALVFACLLVMVVLSALLAVIQNASALAIMALSGGFLAPILTASGGGSHIALFSYYAILNLGIFIIAWKKSWRLLNLMGFAFTFIIAGAWGLIDYQQAHLLSAELFLILFFAMYLIISILYAHKQAPNLKGYVDGTLVFGLPVMAFAMQSALIQHLPFALALSALSLGVLYLGLAYAFKVGFGPIRPHQNYHLLSESFLALGTVFISLSIPFALDGQWVACAWALEGAAVLWVSVKQQRRLGASFAIALQFFGGLGFLIENTPTRDTLPIVNSLFLGAFCVAIAGLFSSYYLMRNAQILPRKLHFIPALLLVWGMCWWLGNGFIEIETYVNTTYHISAMLIFLCLSLFSSLVLERSLNWQALCWNNLGFALFVLALALASFAQLPHFFAAWGGPAWILTLGCWYASLSWRESDVISPKQEKQHRLSSLHNTLLRHLPKRCQQLCSQDTPRTLNALPPLQHASLHLAAIWLCSCILVSEAYWISAEIFLLRDAWLQSIITLPVLAVIYYITAQIHWPQTRFISLYRKIALMPLILYCLGWFLLMSVLSNGKAAPLSYFPLLNPIDITLSLCLAVCFFWWQKTRVFTSEQSQNISSANHRDYTPAPLQFDPTILLIQHASTVYAVCAGLIFLLLNGILLRSLHHWFAIPYNLSAFYNSSLSQACLSIFWTLIGLTVMVLATRHSWRTLWIGAAGLLGITVLKLLFIDLGDSDTLVTIASFIIVGLLLLIVGYYSPIPPKASQDKQPPKPTTE